MEPGESDKNCKESFIFEGCEEEDIEDDLTEDEQDPEDPYDSWDEEGASEAEETYGPPQPPAPEWHSLITRFEVRVVRFVRRKKEQ